MNKFKNITVSCLIFLALIAQVSFSYAEESKPADRTDALIELLIIKGVITREEAIDLKKQLGEEAQDELRSESAVSDEEIIRVEQKVDRMLGQLLQNDRLAEREHQELQKKVEDSVLQKLYKSSWAQRISIGGDIRIRYQGNSYYDENEIFVDLNNYPNALNTTIDRHRFRYRTRLDIAAKIIDERESNVGDMKVGLRLSTGNDDNPISTNDTFGDYQNKDGILLDRAYLSWTWEPMDTVWGGIVPQIFFTGGRIQNPWFRTKGLVWDDDLNFEGAVFKFVSDVQEWDSWSAFLTLGGFVIQEESFSQKDKWLYGGQAGIVLRPTSNLNATFGVAYYDYVNIAGIRNEANSDDLDFTAPLYMQKGNTLFDISDPANSNEKLMALASDFDLANATLVIDYSRFYPVIMSLYGDYVINIGFNKDEIAERANLDYVLKENTGYQLGAKIGYAKIREFGEWNVSMYYRYLERDAVLDAYTDSDFHDGGTNAEGWIANFNLGLFKDVWMSIKGLTSNEISGREEFDIEFAVDIIQVDLNARF
jgi:hypothetical protein